MNYHDACPACRLENPVSREARLNAALLAKKRFDGRAALEEQAKYGGYEGDIALAKLRKAIGFPGAEQELDDALEALIESDRARRLADPRTDQRQFQLLTRGIPESESLAMSHKQRVIWCHRHAEDPTCRVLTEQVAPEEMRARRALRQKRDSAAATNKDKLAARTSGHAVAVQTRKVFLKALEDADFREATHSHENKITLVERGHEAVGSQTFSISASAAGLGRAYQKHAKSVTASEHSWFVSPEILTPAVKALNAAAPKGILYLRADLRAKQGAGTSIKMQTKASPRGAWT